VDDRDPGFALGKMILKQLELVRGLERVVAADRHERVHAERT